MPAINSVANPSVREVATDSPKSQYESLEDVID